MSRSGTVGSYGNSTFSFWRNLLTDRKEKMERYRVPAGHSWPSQFWVISVSWIRYYFGICWGWEILTLTWYNIQAGNSGEPSDPETRGSKGWPCRELCRGPPAKTWVFRKGTQQSCREEVGNIHLALCYLTEPQFCLVICSMPPGRLTQLSFPRGTCGLFKAWSCILIHSLEIYWVPVKCWALFWALRI